MIAGTVKADEVESDESQAGVILDAEYQLDTRRTADMIEAFLKASRG